MEMIDRVKEKIIEEKISIRSLEIKAGLSNGTIKKWEKQKPSYDKVLDIANALNVSVEWLITGKERSDLTPEEKELIRTYRSMNETGKRILLADAKELAPAMQAKPKLSNSTKIG